MSIAGQLQIIAELSIGMAGFAGLVFLLGRARSPSPTSVWRVTNLLGLSFATMITTLISIGLGALGLPEETVWRASCGTLLVVAGGVLSVTLHRYFRLRIISRSTPAKIVGVVGLTIVSLTLVSQLFGMLGLFGALTGAAFYYGLVAMLLLCAIQFMTSVLDRDAESSA